MSTLITIIIFSGVLHIAKADTGYFWHVSDFHWDHTYMGEDLSCNGVVEKYGLFGDYWCDAPWKLVNDSVEAMKALKPDVDFILWTGDNTPHTSDDDVSFQIHDAILGNISNLLSDVFQNVPVYATLGNHDYFPHNQFPAHGNELYNRTFERWQNWIGGDATDTFLKGAYYTVLTSHNLRIVGLNTNLYYTSNKQVGDIADPADQFVWLDNTLKSAKAAGEKVLITGHVPPGVVQSNDRPWMYEQYNTRLNEILISNADVIVGMHFGHEHSDNFRVYHNDAGTGIISQFCAPSVTPWRYKIPGRTGPAHNPSFRLLKYERSTKVLLDFTQYYMDLPEANRNNQSEWKIEYKATSVYDLPDLSPVSMSELVKKMKNSSATEFLSFHKFFTVSVDAAYQEKCDKSCHARFYCNFRYHSTDQYNTCVKSILPVSSATGAHSCLSLMLFVFCLYCLFQYILDN